MKYIVVIPARYKSSRFQGKPLINLDGIPMIIRTYRQCLKVVPAKLIYVATDNQRIKKICLKENINVIMTSSKCLTGTDRVAEVAKKIKANYYVNIQGDEPLFFPNEAPIAPGKPNPISPKPVEVIKVCLSLIFKT